MKHQHDGPRYKADAALEAAKARELARLTRRHIESQLGTARGTSDAFEVAMFEELPPADERGQGLLF